MHFFWLHSTRSVVLIVRFQHVFLPLWSKTKKSDAYIKKGIIPLNGSKEVHQLCLGCHEKPPKIQYTKLRRLSWHTVTLSGLSFAFGITTDSIKQKDI